MHRTSPTPDPADRTERERRWAAVGAHRDRLLRLSRARCANPQDAEDCVQEAMLRAVEFDTLDEERLGPFLTTVTVRLCTDLHRGRSRGDRLSRRLAAYAAAVEPGPEDAVCDRAESVWLSRHVDTLPLRQREIVHARAAGESCGAVAEQLRMSYAAIESALSRARRTLRGALESTLGLAALPSRCRPRLTEAGAVGLGAVAMTAVTFGGLAVVGSAPEHHAAVPAAAAPVGARAPGRSASATRAGAAAAGPAGVVAGAAARTGALPPGEVRPAAREPGGEFFRAEAGGFSVAGDDGDPPPGFGDPTPVDCVERGVEAYPRAGCQYDPDDPRYDEEQIGTNGLPEGIRP